MSESLATATAAPVVIQGVSYPIPTMRDMGAIQAAVPGLTAPERALFDKWKVMKWMESFEGENFMVDWYMKKHKVVLNANTMDIGHIVNEVIGRFLEHNRLLKAESEKTSQ